MTKSNEALTPVRPKENFLIFGAPRIDDAEIEDVVSCMKSGWLGTGPKVTQFEQDMKAYKQVEHAAAVNSCTAALHLSLVASGLKPGDEVTTTPMTFLCDHQCHYPRRGNAGTCRCRPGNHEH